MTELTGKVGFASPQRDKKICERRAAAIELFATLSLAVSLVIAATAVSIGMAHAQTLGTVSHGGSAPLVVGLIVGLVLAGMGGLSAIAGRVRSARE
jgi:hypothetical protein